MVVSVEQMKCLIGCETQVILHNLDVNASAKGKHVW